MSRAGRVVVRSFLGFGRDLRAFLTNPLDVAAAVVVSGILMAILLLHR